MTSPHPRARIAYIAYAFPVLTQTFTVREVEALRDHGLDVRVFAVRRDPAAHLDPVARSHAHTTTYLRASRALASALGWLVRRPVRFVATLLQCLGGRYRDQSLRCRVRSVLHFLHGAGLASCLRADGGYTRVHAQFVDAGSTVGFTAARLGDLPFSFTNHTAYNPYQLPVKARHADVVVSISEFDRERIVADCGEAVRDKVVVSRVGIRVDEWSGPARSPEPGRVLIVGGLREKKGHEVLLRAAARVAMGGVGIRIVVAGDGPARGRLEALAAALGVDGEFLGAVAPAAVRDQLARAQVFALPCHVAGNGDLDGIPVALMEAMAAGVAVVSTRFSGIPELVEDGVCGLLAEPADVDSLAAALARVLRDPELGDRLGAAGCQAVARLHDLGATSRRLGGILETVAP